MSIMEDSGIDSEDKQSNTFEESPAQAVQKMTTIPTTATTEAFDVSAVSHMADLEVVFRGSGGPLVGTAASASVKGTSTKTTVAAAASAGDSDDSTSISTQQSAPNTCRILQRKLELKVERAKRNYSQYQQQEQVRKSQSANLIPISRLSIPGDSEQKPLVDYKSDSSEEPEEISFFPAKVKNSQRQRKTELSDTFSIQEMTIESDLDSDDSGSQNLELLPPLRKMNFLEKVKICFGCGNRRS